MKEESTYTWINEIRAFLKVNIGTQKYIIGTREALSVLSTAAESTAFRMFTLELWANYRKVILSTANIELESTIFQLYYIKWTFLWCLHNCRVIVVLIENIDLK